MALIRTIAEVKTALPRVLSQLSNSALLPDFAAAEIKYLVPLIGFTQYDAINDELNGDNNLSEQQLALLPYLRRLSAIYTYLDDLGTDNAKITDSGIRSTESANLPRVFGWQFKELRNTLQSKAFDATEVLLRFLQEHIDDYPQWASSDEYAAFNSLLIKTGTDFDGHYKLWQPMRTFYSLKILIDEVQEDFIKPGIGDDLLQYFVEGDMAADEEKAILKMLKKAVAYKTIKKCAEHYNVRFDPNGFSVIGSGDSENGETSGRTQVDLTNFELKINACERDAGTWLAKAKKEMFDYRTAGGGEAFNLSYDAGPMADYEEPTRDRKNDERKGFRF